MPTIYGAIDLSKNELRNAVVQNLGSAPSSPVKGQIYMDSAQNNLYFYDGTAWVSTRAAGALTPAASVTNSAVGDTAVTGVSTNYARQDHTHGREAFGAVFAETTFGSGSANGVAATVAHSDHAHGNPAHNAAAHSAIPLSALAAPTANIDMQTWTFLNLGAPNNVGDAANKGYVDNLVAGLSWKDAVRVATTANITQSGTIPVDGVTVSVGNRVLCKNQTTGSQNGIWIAAAGAWTRATDADAAAEIDGMAVFVEEGTTQADTAWVCTTNTPITVDTTSLTFAQFAGGGTINAGAGILQTGNTFDVVAADSTITVNADSIQVNTAQVTPTARTITAGNGLTGGGDLTANRTVDFVAGDTSLTVAADSVVVNTGVIATVASVNGKASLLTPTANQTGAYSAAVGQMVNCNTSSGAFTVTLPAAPVDGAMVGVRLVGPAGPTNAVTVARGGTDTIGGATTWLIRAQWQWAIFQYVASGTVWWVNDGFNPGTMPLNYLQTPNADLNMATRRILNVADAASATDALTWQAGDLRYPTKGQLTAKGDIYAASNSGIVARQPVGTDGQVLIADSSQTMGLRWGTATAAGTVIKYAAALTGTASPETVTHNLGTRDISLTVYNGATPYTAVEVDWDATTTTTATIRYSPNLGAGYRVVVMG